MSTKQARQPKPSTTTHEPRANKDPRSILALTLKAEPRRRDDASRPENELLLTCARSVTGGASSSESLRELTGTAIDWDYLYGLAERHAVLPLLHRGLEREARGVAPRDFTERLREKYQENATRNMLLAGELVRIAQLFESEGVPVLAYKGPALAVQAYGELSLRRFIDLDVLVRKEDARRAGELLLSLGFDKPEGLTEAHERFLLRRQHNLAFARDAGRLTVELHWEVAPSLFASVPLGARAWERAVTVELFGCGVKSLSPEETLLALCVHGTKHLWERLAWVCDVAALLNSHPDLDWSFVLGQARETRIERMLLLGLSLARNLVGARLPASLFDECAQPIVKRLSADVEERLFEGAVYEPPGFLHSVGFNLRARRRLREKAGYLRFIFTPTEGDLRAVSLPSRLSFFYYMLRPFRLLLKRDVPH